MAPRARLCLCHVAALFESDRDRDRERESELERTSARAHELERPSVTVLVSALACP